MDVVTGTQLQQNHVESPRVVITMPAYNAEATLARTVAEIPDGVADQLILVDDASPDNTVQLARELGIEVHVHPENRGYGGNQKTCYSMALKDDADIVVMLHPDYQYEPRAVPLLIAPILAGHADMTFGSRFAGLSDPRSGGMPAHRYAGNRTTTLVENLLLGCRFSEMHSGMRAYTRNCLLSLPFRRYSNDFLFDSQLLVDAVTTGQTVIEVPIPTRYTDESSSIGIRSSLSYVAGSLGYCARRVWVHGRRHYRAPRGRRYARSHAACGAPVGGVDCSVCGRLQPHIAYSAALRECAGCGLVSSLETPHLRALPDGDSVFLEWALTAIEGYFVSGNRLLTNPEQARSAASAGWGLVGAQTSAHAVETGVDRVDAVLLTDWGQVASLGGLVGVRALVRQDGLLALVTPCLRASEPDRSLPYQVRPHALDRALSDAGFRLIEWARLPRAPARAYRRWVTSSKHVALPTERSDIVLVVARPAGAALQ